MEPCYRSIPRMENFNLVLLTRTICFFAVDLAFVQRTSKRANRPLPVHVFFNASAGCYK